MKARSSTGEKSKKMTVTSRPLLPPPEELTAATTTEEEEQQQMERFYALVANVRALRAMFKEAALPSCSDDDVCGGGGGGGGELRKKRPRAAPWRPAFEMADFECGGTTTDTEAVTTMVQDCNCKKKGKRSAANSAAEDNEGEVVEGKPAAVAIVVDGPGKSTMPDKN